MSRTLWGALGEVPDSRGAQGRQYTLQSVLGISTGAMLAGANDLRAIFRWGRRLKPEALHLLGIEDGKAPCHATYHYVFKSLDAGALAATLGKFALGDDRVRHIAIDGKTLSPAQLLAALNDLGRKNGIGRLDLVENRFVGMKSRGLYETPGGTILHAAHRGIEQITLDRGAAHLKDELMPKYAELIYNGFWFTPEREMLQAAIDKSQEFVTGAVTLKLYKGGVGVVGRTSPFSLYDQDLVTFEEGKVAYDHRDAAGFIRLNALRLRTLAQRKKKLKLEK